MSRSTVLLWALLLAGLGGDAATAIEVTLNPGGSSSNIGVSAGDPSIAQEQDFPSSLPYSNTQSVDLGATNVSASYDFDTPGFVIDFDMAVSGNSGSGADVGGEVYFSVDEPVDYIASGLLSGMHPAGYDVLQDFLLEEVVAGTLLFRSMNRGDSTADTEYTVGVASGDVTSVSGEFSGTLDPGVEYHLLWIADFEIHSDSAPGSATGFFSFLLVPEPGTWALLAGGLLTLGLVRRPRRA